MPLFSRLIALVSLLALGGTTAALSADPKKNDCMKAAKLHAELRCSDAKWKATRVYDWEAGKYMDRQPFESYDQCYSIYYSTKMSTCKD